METTKFIEQKKKVALNFLAPLGFVDNEDAEYPGTIYHPETKESYDISATDIMKIILLVYRRGIERGEQKTQAVIRMALGVEAK